MLHFTRDSPWKGREQSRRMTPLRGWAPLHARRNGGVSDAMLQVPRGRWTGTDRSFTLVFLHQTQIYIRNAPLQQFFRNFFLNAITLSRVKLTPPCSI